MGGQNSAIFGKHKSLTGLDYLTLAGLVGGGTAGAGALGMGPFAGMMGGQGAAAGGIGASNLAGGLGAGAADEVMGGLAMGSPAATPGMLGNASLALGNFNSQYPAVGKFLGNKGVMSAMGQMAGGQQGGIAPPPPPPMPQQAQAATQPAANIIGNFYGNQAPHQGPAGTPSMPGIGDLNLNIRKRLGLLGFGGY